MENKPKVFKTLVHKETGEWGVVFKNTDLVPDGYSIKNVEQALGCDLSDYDLKEVVVIPREEYERLKSIEKDYIRQGNVNTELIRKK